MISVIEDELVDHVGSSESYVVQRAYIRKCRVQSLSRLAFPESSLMNRSIQICLSTVFFSQSLTAHINFFTQHNGLRLQY